MKIADDVFFRRYDDNTIIYQTSKSKVYLMSGECFEILDSVKEDRNISELEEILLSKKIVNNEEEINELKEFVNQLYELGLLVEPISLSLASKLEADMFDDGTIPAGTLYNCMFELTYRCNERCKHCYCVTDNADGELSTDEIKGVIDQLSEMNTFELTFTGGDLFVRDDTFEILEYAYSKGFLINIFTNGIALKEDDFYRLQRIHPKSISFSIYDTIPDKHDAFTTVNGSFARTFAAAKKCRSLGISVNIKSNVTRDNMPRVEDLVRLVHSIGANLEVTLSITPRNDGDMSSTQYRLENQNDYDEVVIKLNDLLSEDSEKSFSFRPDENRKLCWAGERGLSINPYGKVFACNALLIECGDVRKQTISDIWNNSEELKKIRTYRTHDLIGCDDCKDRDYCAFCMGNALNETGNPLKKYSEACNITKAQRKLGKEK